MKYINHVWIQDKVDFNKLSKNYATKGAKVYWRGGKPRHMDATYQGIPVRVRFYTKDQADNHHKLYLWCGLDIQRVVLLEEDIREESLIYLVSRLRSKRCPLTPWVDPDTYVMEITERFFWVVCGTDTEVIERESITTTRLSSWLNEKYYGM